MIPRLLTTLAAALLQVAPLAAQSAFPSDSALHELLATRLVEGGAKGVVIGMLEPDGGTRFFAAGDAGAGRRLDEHAVFEIGSITKVLTGTLLAEMAGRREVALGDPVSKYLPVGVSLPARNNVAITLEHLATQRSGLPRMPGNVRPADPRNPYADYGAQQLYEFLDAYNLTRDPGAVPEYSNLGVGLLGHVLSLRAGVPYETLLRTRILEPLGMSSTTITLSPAQRGRLVAGHDVSGDTVPGWDFDVLAGAGAVRSTAADMLKLAAAALRPEGRVGTALRLAMAPRAPIGEQQIGLLWMRRPAGADTIVWHNGGTGGFRSFLGVVPGQRTAVVLLSNTGGPGLDDVAMHLLVPSLPLGPPPRAALALPTEVLARYTGSYRLAPQFTLVVRLEDDALTLQPTGQARVRLWPSSETEFFVREVDARVTFQLGADGAVTGLVLHQNGRDLPARREP